MVAIKRKVTLRTKTAQEETQEPAEERKVTLKKKQPQAAETQPEQPKEEPKREAEPKSHTAATSPNGQTAPAESPNQQDEKKSKVVWVVAGVAVAAVAAGLLIANAGN